MLWILDNIRIFGKSTLKIYECENHQRHLNSRDYHVKSIICIWSGSFTETSLLMCTKLFDNEQQSFQYLPNQILTHTHTQTQFNKQCLIGLKSGFWMCVFTCMYTFPFLMNIVLMENTLSIYIACDIKIPYSWNESEFELYSISWKVCVYYGWFDINWRLFQK